MTYRILYRGPLTSCNYGCAYCPFAKKTNSRAELLDDEARLNRFADWVGQHTAHRFGILFTPWGEGAIHPSYQRVLTRLSHHAHVERVAIQTNLSGRLDWVARARQESLALWCTFHPSETTLEAFLQQCQVLDRHHVRYSVGMVGTRENIPLMRRLRERLPAHVYFWVNAYKPKARYYRAAELDDLAQIDPLFPLNSVDHASAGKSCHAGETAFSVDGDGNMYRCHFIKTRLGNLYDGDFPHVLQPRACPNATCGCHIGYVHLKDLQLETVFGDGILERIPRDQPPQLWRDSRQVLSSRE